MSYFNKSFGRSLEALAKGKKLTFQVLEMPDFKRSTILPKYYNLPENTIKHNYEFWMDEKTGELCAEYYFFTGDAPDELDEINLYRGVEVFGFLFDLCELVPLYASKVSEARNVSLNEDVMALGLDYLLNVMRIIDEYTQAEFEKVEAVRDTIPVLEISKHIYNGNIITYEDFIKTATRRPLAAVIAKLRAVDYYKFDDTKRTLGFSHIGSFGNAILDGAYQQYKVDDKIYTDPNNKQSNIK